MNFSDRIRKIREIFNMTQKDMAKELGISQAYLCNIENGKNNANADVIFKLTLQFGVKPLWLAEGVGDMFVYPIRKATSMIHEKENFYSSVDKIYSEVEKGKLIGFKVNSDNMEPLFHIGDLVLVDTTDTELQHLSVYLFETEFKMFFKRFIGGTSMKLTNEKVSSKNNDMLMTSSIKCIGRAVWIIREMK
ncbi:helix-turn-helix domain-containing protein [bacterium]|nr:helix-turn-helix domain-containing protein [bacterium]